MHNPLALAQPLRKPTGSGRNLMVTHVLAIDQGTTSSRAIVFRADISIAAVAQQEFPQHFPASGWVEHEPEDIWTSTVATCREAMKKAGIGPNEVAAIGITNHRETAVVWDRATGQAVHRAIVWQDRRTADICAQLKTDGHEPAISAKTGLIIDPYFSGTKIAWILDHVPGARARDARRTAVRHRGLLSLVAADRRQGSRDRRHQRLPHAAVRYSHRTVGRNASGPPAGAARDAAGGEGFVCAFR
jgi:glycerol kinase